MMEKYFHVNLWLCCWMLDGTEMYEMIETDRLRVVWQDKMKMDVSCQCYECSTAWGRQSRRTDWGWSTSKWWWGGEVLSHSRSDQNHHSSSQSVSVPMHSLLFIITVQPATALLISPVTAGIDWCRTVLVMLYVYINQSTVNHPNVFLVCIVPTISTRYFYTHVRMILYILCYVCVLKYHFHLSNTTRRVTIMLHGRVTSSRNVGINYTL